MNNATTSRSLNYQDLYEALGYLFYGIAVCDKKIETKETEKLRELVKKNWLPMEDSEDGFGMDNAHAISITYDMLMDRGVSCEEAWENFREYYALNREMFSNNVKNMIVVTAEDIAKSYWNTNKAEEHMLHKLKDLFSIS